MVFNTKVGKQNIKIIDLEIMKIETAIKNEKAKLINKVNKKGLYENFGQKEVSKLESKFIDSSDYSDKMNDNRNQLDSFNEWCMTYVEMN